MKFLVEAPVALVPFQLEDICSALGNARALSAFKLEDVWKDCLLSVRRTGNLWIRMAVVRSGRTGRNLGELFYATNHVNDHIFLSH